MKTQNVRLFDVLVLGPFMVWAGYKARGIPGWARAGIVAAGVGTIVYNGKNYLEAQAVEAGRVLPEVVIRSGG